MNNTGSEKRSLSNIDLILINIALFCGCIILLTLFTCCRRKKPGKRKALQRKRKKSSKCEKVTSLNSQSSLSSDSSSSGSIGHSPGRKNHNSGSSKTTGSFTSSILYHLKASPQKQNDEESGKQMVIKKQGNKKQGNNRKKKAPIVKNHKATKMNDGQLEKSAMIDLSITSNNVQLMELSPSTSNSTSSKKSTSDKKHTSNKRKCTSNGECPGPDLCKKCNPFREHKLEKTTDKSNSEEQSLDERFVEISMPVITDYEPWEEIDHPDAAVNEKTTNNEIEIKGQSKIEEKVDDTISSQKLSLYDEIKYPPRKKEEIIPNEIEKKETQNCNIGHVFDIKDYVSREWKGKTTKAETISKGYFDIPAKLGLYNVRVIRGDNYCGVRATLFQALVQNIPILQNYAGKIQQIPQQLMMQGCSWIEEWNFARRIVSTNTCETIKECLEELSKLVSLSSKMVNNEGRESHLLSCVNFQEASFEIRLLEAVKLLMLTSAIKLHKDMTSGKDVPVFAVIMFARDTSENPYQFMKNHLNSVGDSGGLEQVEMHLLGYSLGLTIKVVRPYKHGQDDFIASYPNDMPSNTPSVTLVAEDDRHYNILI